jgi:hypothetical protein
MTPSTHNKKKGLSKWLVISVVVDVLGNVADFSQAVAMYAGIVLNKEGAIMLMVTYGAILVSALVKALRVFQIPAL